MVYQLMIFLCKEFLEHVLHVNNFYDMKLHGGLRGSQVLEYDTVAIGLS